MEFATEGESSTCHTCNMDYWLHYGAAQVVGVWPKCPPVVLLPPRPVRMVYPPNVIQVDFVRKERVA
jgi:hypothetical protein